MIQFLAFLNGNKKLVISGAILLGLFIYGAILTGKIRKANNRIEILVLEAQQDSALILKLTRDKIDLSNDTAKYRSDIRLIGDDIKRLKQTDAVKELSSRYPSLDQLKKKGL